MANKYYIVYQTDFYRYSIEITNRTSNHEYFVSLDLDEVDLNALMEMLDSLGFVDLSPEGDEE